MIVHCAEAFYLPFPESLGVTLLNSARGYEVTSSFANHFCYYSAVSQRRQQSVSIVDARLSPLQTHVCLHCWRTSVSTADARLSPLQTHVCLHYIRTSVSIADARLFSEVIWHCWFTLIKWLTNGAVTSWVRVELLGLESLEVTLEMISIMPLTKMCFTENLDLRSHAPHLCQRSSQTSLLWRPRQVYATSQD